MGFIDDEKTYGPVTVPDGLDLTPAPKETSSISQVVGAAFRSENPIVSAINSFDHDPQRPFDPDYRPFEDIQGTQYEAYADRFTGVRDREDMVRVQRQIDRELDDRSTLDSAGLGGIVAQVSAAVLSPTSLLPGGVIVKGAQGVKIGSTTLSVAAAAGGAAILDEAALQGTQQTRSAEESAFAIGGSVILGGILGAGAGALTRTEFTRAAKAAEETLQIQHDLTEGLRSVGAAEARTDLSLRGEEAFQAIRKVPLLRGLVRSDPILRTTMSELPEARRVAVDLIETPLQFRVNDEGQSVRNGESSVETRIKDRERNQMVGALAGLKKHYGEYWNDGPVGTLGTITQPFGRFANNLTGRSEKLGQSDFMQEVGRAMRRGDKHPIPQVQAAADMLRRDIFDPLKDEAIELGLFDPDLQIKNADSYFSRVYNQDRIRLHYGDGSENDISVVLRAEFARKRDEAAKRLAEETAEEGAEVAAKSAERAADEFYANASDAEIQEAVNETIRNIIGLNAGEPSFGVAFASPTRARVLDVADELLEPWLEDHATDVMSQYFRSIVPQLEIVRKFGNLSMTNQLDEIQRAAAVKMSKAKNSRERKRIDKEARENVADLTAMRDRLLGRYGVPANPRSVWVQGGRAARTVSYMGFLGGMTVSAIPDLAGLVGRAGLMPAFGASVEAVTNPRRLGIAMKDAAEFGAAAEWYLNNRALSTNEMFDPYGAGTKMERVLSQGATGFSVATGMIPWNFGWKSVGGAMIASRMAKAATRMRDGNPSTKDKRFLGANGIEPWMAERIAKQVEKHGDRRGWIWLTNGRKWDDDDAFRAMREAMNREMDLMVVTPGQDKPLSFSTEPGKFFLQFKSFAFSAHHRIMLAGIQKADADAFAQVTMAILLGALVSNIKADLGGYDRKEGTAYWEDAVDRSGLTGWLMEPYNIASGVTGGATSVSGESVSRYQARSIVQGMAGPSVDMAAGFAEGLNAMATGKHSYRDVRKLMRPIPGNNLVWFLDQSRMIEDALVEMTGARPRE